MFKKNDQTDRLKNKSTSDEISFFLSKIQNKYSGNADQKHINQLYDLGILVANKKFDRKQLVETLTKIVEKRSFDPIKKIRDNKKKILLDAFRKGIEDGLSDEYRMAYDGSNRYQYDSEKLRIRGHIDHILDNNRQFNN